MIVQRCLLGLILVMPDFLSAKEEAFDLKLLEFLGAQGDVEVLMDMANETYQSTLLPAETDSIDNAEETQQ